MTELNIVRSEYSRWLYDLVCNDTYSRRNSFRKLFNYLEDTEFYYTHPMDGNRYDDGIELRYIFGREFGYPDSLIAEALDDHPCSVLEMLIALSIKCEEKIMDNHKIGDRTGQWFWTMIVNLGLGSMNDSKFDAAKADLRMDIFMERRYEKNGEGGCLFKIENPNRDMRTADIWYQMCWYLGEYLEGDDNE